MDLNTAQKNLGPGPCQRQHCKEWPQHRCLQTLLVTTAMDVRHVNHIFFVILCDMSPGCKDMSQKITILRHVLHVFLLSANFCDMTYCLCGFCDISHFLRYVATQSREIAGCLRKHGGIAIVDSYTKEEFRLIWMDTTISLEMRDAYPLYWLDCPHPLQRSR
jgi:hypothetical protein